MLAEFRNPDVGNKVVQKEWMMVDGQMHVANMMKSYGNRSYFDEILKTLSMAALCELNLCRGTTICLVNPAELHSHTFACRMT